VTKNEATRKCRTPQPPKPKPPSDSPPSNEDLALENARLKRALAVYKSAYHYMEAHRQQGTREVMTDLATTLQALADTAKNHAAHALAGREVASTQLGVAFREFEVAEDFLVENFPDQGRLEQYKDDGTIEYYTADPLCETPSGCIVVAINDMERERDHGPGLAPLFSAAVKGGGK